MNYTQHIIDTVARRAKPANFQLFQNGFNINFDNFCFTAFSYGSLVSVILSDRENEKIQFTCSLKEFTPLLPKLLQSDCLSSSVPGEVKEEILYFFKNNSYAGEVSSKISYVAASTKENAPKFLLGRLLYSGNIRHMN